MKAHSEFEHLVFFSTPWFTLGSNTGILRVLYATIKNQGHCARTRCGRKRKDAKATGATCFTPGRARPNLRALDVEHLNNHHPAPPVVHSSLHLSLSASSNRCPSECKRMLSHCAGLSTFCKLDNQHSVHRVNNAVHLHLADCALRTDAVSRTTLKFPPY